MKAKLIIAALILCAVLCACLLYTGLAAEERIEQSPDLIHLEELGCSEGDTVRMYGLRFDYYKESE